MSIEIKNENDYRVAILKTIDEFCSARSITYALAWGSMIGAVRERGIIPWDYDIDVMMPRADFSRFVRSFSDPKGRYEVWEHTVLPDYGQRIALVVDNLTDCSNLSVPRYHPLRHISVEIYPVDYVPRDKAYAEKYFNRIDALAKVNRIKMSYWDPSHSRINNYIKLLARLLLKPFDEMAVMSRMIDHAPVDGTEEMTFLAIGKRYQSVRVANDFFDNLLRVPFETIECCIPKDYDSFLTAHYGNYMQRPSESEIERSMRLQSVCSYRFTGGRK